MALVTVRSLELQTCLDPEPKGWDHGQTRVPLWVARWPPLLQPYGFLKFKSASGFFIF